MCGIAGIVSFNQMSHPTSLIKKMSDIIHHRGPDGEGVWCNEDSSIHFGHRRLSIIDLTTNGAQPLTRQDYVITYNGEIYNYKELREQLSKLGIIFHSASDTEVVLYAYIVWGEQCVDYFNGMWAFAIYDPVKQQVFCSRDRFGIKPFYYCVLANQFYFASEIKSFTVLENWKAKVNKARAYDFLANGYINHTEETLFDNIFELRGGNNLILDTAKGSFFVKKYYHLEKINEIKDVSNESALINDYRLIFDSAVQLALRSDVKVGSALSGGIDSSCLVGSMVNELHNQASPITPECVSACFNEKEIDESYYIDAVSNKFNVDVHKVYPNFDQFKENFEKLIWHQEEPFPTLSIFAQFCVFEESAKKNLTVMLDGQGADEILAGYDSFYRPYFISLFKNNLGKGFIALMNYLKIHTKYPVFNFISNLFKSRKQNNQFLNSAYFNSIVKFIRSKDTSIRKATFNHLEEYGLHSLLRYEDKNSMTFSVESRVPFLDHRLVEFGISLSDNLKINNGVRKFILRESCKDVLPDEVFRRYDKYGFLTPQEVWTKVNNEFFESELNRSIKNCSLIFSKDVIDTYAKRKSDKKFLYFIWRIICFNKWVEVFNVSIE